MENSFLGEYDIRFEGEKVGTLWVYPKGLVTLFEARCRHSANAVCRLYCICGGAPVSLGIPVPAGNILKLNRSFTKNDMERMGLDSIDGCVLIAEKQADEALHTPWSPEKDVEACFEDEVLKRSASKLKGALSRQRGRLRELAIPYDGARPFALMPAFCFCRSCDIDGRNYLVLTLRDRVICIAGE